MILKRLISKPMIIKSLAPSLGIPPSSIEAAFSIIDQGLNSLGVEGDAVSMLVGGGDWRSKLGGVYNKYLLNENNWRLVANFVAEYLQEADTNQDLLPIIGAASKLPFTPFDKDFSSVEDFFESGVFPLLAEVHRVRNVCDACDVETEPFDELPGVRVCPTCGTYF